MFIKGFKFGMLLQLAIGPVCLFIFNTAVSSGFLFAEFGVLGVAFMDGLFILLAILGVGKFLENSDRIKKIIGYFGGGILIIFGLSLLLSSFGISILPKINLLKEVTSKNIFLKAIILTGSNPLGIIFWAGVFSAKIIEEKMTRNNVYSFGIGACFSTLLFLTCVAMMGSLITNFLSLNIVKFLNVAVGFILIIFGFKTLKRP